MTHSTSVSPAQSDDMIERVRAVGVSAAKGVDRFFSKNTMTKLMTLLLLVLGPTATMAIVAPATGTFGYDIYDLVVNDILNGAIGFVGGVLVIVWGASRLMQSWMIAVLTIIAGSVIIEADAVVASLGMML